MTAFLMIFRRFPKIFQNCSEGQTNFPKHFPRISVNLLLPSLLKRGTALKFSVQVLNVAKSAFKVVFIEQFFGNFVAEPNLEQNLQRPPS